LQPEPFFSGPGLDRADSLRADPNRIRELGQREDARELIWKDGLPAIGSAGELQWRKASDPALFLGLDREGVPSFSALQAEVASGPAVFSLLADLDAEDAPLFATALSLARWHSRHRFCANCGAQTEIVRGGWSRRCPACSAEHFPRVDPVVIMLAEHEASCFSAANIITPRAAIPRSRDSSRSGRRSRPRSPASCARNPGSR
jgi:NAD+ diphosphatase